MDMSQEVPVKLTDDELLERGKTLAEKNLHIESLQAKKKADAKRTQGFIDEELAEAARLARVITGQEEVRKQADLFVGDVVATDALAQVGEAACTCESKDVAAVDCPVHGTIPGNGETKPPNGETAAGLEEAPPEDPADDAEPLPPAV